MNRITLDSCPDILTVKDLQNLLHISRSGAYALVNAADFPTLHIGKRKLVSRSALLQWLEEHTD